MNVSQNQILTGVGQPFREDLFDSCLGFISLRDPLKPSVGKVGLEIPVADAQ